VFFVSKDRSRTDHSPEGEPAGKLAGAQAGRTTRFQAMLNRTQPATGRARQVDMFVHYETGHELPGMTAVDPLLTAIGLVAFRAEDALRPIDQVANRPRVVRVEGKRQVAGIARVRGY